jgi:hypothetical protein
MDRSKNPREIENELLIRCTKIAVGEVTSVDNTIDANVCRVAGVILDSKHPKEAAHDLLP